VIVSRQPTHAEGADALISSKPRGGIATERSVPWLIHVLAQKPESKTRIGSG
jgi:hypothetical protein